jgi:cytochrome c oxidase subunit III
MITMSTQPKFSAARSPLHRQRNAQIIALIAMASFGMLFGTFLLSFLLAQARNVSWPPIGVSPINYAFAYLSTGLILASSVLYAHAQKSHTAENLVAAKWSVMGTWALAVAFLALQYITLKQLWSLGQGINSDIYSGSVHVLIGLHAIHLLGGLIGLSFVAIKLFFFKTVSATAVQIVGWFWHFLGVLWTLIFLVLVL